MNYTATWFRNNLALCSEKAADFHNSREIARSKLAVHRIRSGATHVEVRSDDGVLVFDSRVPVIARVSRPGVAAHLARGWALNG